MLPAEAGKKRVFLHYKDQAEPNEPFVVATEHREPTRKLPTNGIR
jgi:hypothetical protein